MLTPPAQCLDGQRQQCLTGAFTLLELLVVMAIIGILVGLSLPALSKARKSSQVAACLNNTKQLSAAFHLYSEDQGQRFPYAIYRPVNGGSVYGFDDFIYAYLGVQLTIQEQQATAIPLGKRTRVLTCPADKAAPSPFSLSTWRRTYSIPEADMGGSLTSGGVGIYYSSFWGPAPPANPAQHKALGESQIGAPGLTLLIVERPHSGNWGGNDHYAVTRNTGDQMDCFNTLTDGMSYHGRGRFVYAYCDGRAEVKKRQDTWGKSRSDFAWEGEWTIRTDD